MKRFLTSLIILINICGLSGQINKTGIPVIRNYGTEEILGSELNYCITSDLNGVMYFGTNEKGVMRYDGSRWTTIDVKENNRIYSLDCDSHGIIYVGGGYEFGYLAPSATGKMGYISLSDRLPDSLEIGVIYSMDEFKGKMYMTNLTYLFCFDPETDSLSWINMEEDYSITKVITISALDDRLVLADNRRGLYQYDGEKITKLPGGEFFEMTLSLVILPHNDDELIIGTFNNRGAFLLNYKTGVVDTSFFEPEVAAILRMDPIYKGTNLANGMFALGTTGGEGILIFDSAGQLVNKLDATTSNLGDVTIWSLYYNEKFNSELWVGTLGFISKIYLDLPYTLFDSRAGVETGINRIMEFNKRIYLSTDWGVMVNETDPSGRVVFRPVKGIDYQVFPLKVFNAGNKSMLLAGSNLGLFVIDENNHASYISSFREKDRTKGVRKKSYDIKTIRPSQFHKNRAMLGTTGTGVIFVEYGEDGTWYYGGNVASITGEVTSIVEESASSVWAATTDPVSLFNIKINGADTSIYQVDGNMGINPETVTSIENVDGNVAVFTKNGIFKYVPADNNFIPFDQILNGYSENKISYKVFEDPESDIWYVGNDGKNFLALFQTSREGVIFHRSVFSVLPRSPIQDIAFIDGKLWLAISKSVYVIDKDNLNSYKVPFSTLHVKISVGQDSILMEDSFPIEDAGGVKLASPVQDKDKIPLLGYSYNDISFYWTTSYFIDEGETEYSFMLEGFENRWSRWDKVNYKDFTNLSSGHYIFRLKSRTITGLESAEVTYEFVIKRPWYATIIAFIIYIILTAALVLAIIKAYTKRLKNENIRLEGIVAERTLEVVKQKEELESSIHYASRIQRALLPSEKVLEENLDNYFILFKPRDIVSGDFFWMTKKDERLYIVAADCTGHGVPGAFMSLLGISFLDEIIVNQTDPVRADYILNELRIHVTESLKQVGDDDEAKDGMDIAILVLDFKKEIIEFSGAYNPCFKIRSLTEDEKKMRQAGKLLLPEGSMINDKYRLDTINSDKMPIGISSRMKVPFSLNEWDFEKGVSYYLFSDGYVDQFGGNEGRKFMKKNFKKLLLDIQDLPMEEQKVQLEANLMEWMGASPQIDDILIVGLRP